MYPLHLKPKTVVAIVLVVAFIVISIFLFRNDEELEDKILDEILTEEAVVAPKSETIGTSVEGRAINAYTYGAADENGKHIIFVGGMHGGYEWNTVSLGYAFLDYLDTNPEFVPDNTEVTIIASINPDGLQKVVGKEGRFVPVDIASTVDQSIGRFNANGVDLNRNFDCKWKPESTWRNKVVSAGTKAFSEPEALALKNFVSEAAPDAVIFWHSQGNSVFASECLNGILPETLAIMNAYATASGYTAVPKFDAYEITGDAEGWLASIGIPALTVELSTHETVEFEKNLAGVKAVLSYYSK